MAGPVQTTSLADKQHDYFQATRTSPFTLTAPTSYSIHLTADPTPLYRIEVDPRPTADPAIQLFDLDDPFPVAVARMHPHVIPEAAVCTREPAGPNAIWHPFSDNYAVLYVESVPGLPAVQRGVRWWPKQTKNLTCSIIGSLFGIPEEDMVLARYGMLGRSGADMVLQVARGGGIEFELGIVMQLFVRLELDRRRNAKKGKKR
ncbi:hypothetical protein V498_03744 [Pseudogymnoascus sp. VKM F-4517 (FW-2822)]|nr:hypothetical protein V498_03744 [Pseudogymnoascus sp. VKM F-4517 (FW-2822)]